MAKKRTLEEKIALKLREPMTIFLLGGGASFCAGLPGTLKLTELVLAELHGVQGTTINKIKKSLADDGIQRPSIEEILSELYHRMSGVGKADPEKDRYGETFEKLCQSIRNALKVDSSTEYHREFVRRFVSRRESEPAKKTPPAQIFTTNYDLLIELACEESNVVVINGFEGIFVRRWNPYCFDYDIGTTTTHSKTPRFDPSARHLRLYKLHGSISWFESHGQFYESEPNRGSEMTPLIIYPSRLKYAESIRPPFDWLFRKFGEALSNARLLISIGYRFADDNLNQYIFAGISNGLTLLALSKSPIEALASKFTHHRVSMMNEEGTTVDGKDQGETTDLWSFESFSNWYPALKKK